MILLKISQNPLMYAATSIVSGIVSNIGGCMLKGVNYNAVCCMSGACVWICTYCVTETAIGLSHFKAIVEDTKS